MALRNYLLQLYPEYADICHNGHILRISELTLQSYKLMLPYIIFQIISLKN